MAQWKTTVDLHDQWLGRIAEDGKLVEWDNKHVSELASIVAGKLRSKFPEQLDPDSSKFDPELEDVVYYFDTVDDYLLKNFPRASIPAPSWRSTRAGVNPNHRVFPASSETAR